MEYRVIKAFDQWKVGDRFFPNTCVSGGQRNWLVANGFIVPLGAVEVATKQYAEAAAKHDTPKPIETAMYEHGEPRKRGRPRKSILPGPPLSDEPDEEVETVTEHEGDES